MHEKKENSQVQVKLGIESTISSPRLQLLNVKLRKIQGKINICDE